MPIDRTRFEAGEHRYSIERVLLDFLQANPDRAFTVTEVTAEVVDAGFSEGDDVTASTTGRGVVDVATVSAVLDRLVDDGAVHRHVIETERGPRSYYRTP